MTSLSEAELSAILAEHRAQLTDGPTERTEADTVAVGDEELAGVL